MRRRSDLKSFWRGKKIVITAGPTREPLDPVRFLTNASSGRMGYALAAEARRLGARAIVISGPTHLAVPRGVLPVRVTTAREMLRATLRHGLSAHLVVGAAAVADWRPHISLRKKLKKDRSVQTMTIRLVRNPDILRTIARRRRFGRPRLAGFALETGNLLENATKKLHEKSLDLIVANTPSALEKVSTRAVILTRSGRLFPFEGTKPALARTIFSVLSRETE